MFGLVEQMAIQPRLKAHQHGIGNGVNLLLKLQKPEQNGEQVTEAQSLTTAVELSTD